MGIVSFKNRTSRDIAAGVITKITRRCLPVELHFRAQMKVAMINKAKTLADLNVPGNNLEKLSGNRQGQWSIRINDRYRICFLWNSGSVSLVEITDYH